MSNAGEIFSEVYDSRRWDNTFKLRKFYSGFGSEPKYTDEYVARVRDHLEKRAEYGRFTVVDLGCGDMLTGSRLLGEGWNYVGVDCVPGLIEHLLEQDFPSGTTFGVVDLIEDELPKGEVALLRQVLQHLDNASVVRVLDKLKDRYEEIWITDYQSDAPGGINLDMTIGAGLRPGGGLDLNKPPFNFDAPVALTYDFPFGEAMRGRLVTWRWPF